MYLISGSLSWMCGSSDEEAESEESSCCEIVTRENEEQEQGRSQRGYLFCEHRGAWNVYPKCCKNLAALRPMEGRLGQGKAGGRRGDKKRLQFLFMERYRHNLPLRRTVMVLLTT
jgi:hypothetical protein